MCSGDAGGLHQIARLIGAAADISDSAGRATSAALDATVNVSTTAATFFGATAANALSLTYECWRGIDLSNITVHHHTGRSAAEDSTVLVHWLWSDAGLRTADLT